MCHLSIANDVIGFRQGEAIIMRVYRHHSYSCHVKEKKRKIYVTFFFLFVSVEALVTDILYWCLYAVLNGLEEVLFHYIILLAFLDKELSYVSAQQLGWMKYLVRI